jgi:hypothetical protein
MQSIPSPQELDAQSPVDIDEWVDIGSVKFYEIVGEDISSFDYFIRVGFRDPPFLYTDSLGRVWGKLDTSNKWFPFHDLVNGKAYGYRYPGKAIN